MANPFPALKVQPGSITVPWAEFQGNKVEGTFDAHFGPDGVGLGMVFEINWSDLAVFIQQVLGYSWRDVSSGTPTLRRVLPFQHPYFPQLVAKAVTRVQGVRLEGKGVYNLDANAFGLATASASYGSIFSLAVVTVSFWRPPYYLLTDNAVLFNGVQREYLRYVDKHWSVNVQMLSRESSQFVYRIGLGNSGLPGAVGQKVCHCKLSKTWYDVPEQCLFLPGPDGALNGVPWRLLYTTTPTLNPITSGLGGATWQYPTGSPIIGCVNSAIASSEGLPAQPLQVNLTNHTTAGSNVISNMTGLASVFEGDIVTGIGIPPNTFVTSVTETGGVGSITISNNALYTTNANVVMIEDKDYMFFGFPTGTLLLEGIELTPKPLHLPPQLMQIGVFNGNEPIAQQQYDVTFRFDYHNPVPDPSEPFRGHNLVPWPGNGCWRSIRTQNDTNIPATAAGPYRTPFDFADFSDLFLPL